MPSYPPKGNPAPKAVKIIAFFAVICLIAIGATAVFDNDDAPDQSGNPHAINQQ